MRWASFSFIIVGGARESSASETVRKMQDDYVAVDLEMTGLNFKTDRILEVGAARVRGGVVTETFSSLVAVDTELPTKVVELTGITDEMAKTGENPETVLPRFFEFLGEDVLVGQNIVFDYGFLKQWAVNRKMPFERGTIDTLKLARRFLPADEKKDLESLCRYFGVKRECAHRALSDALAAGEIFEHMKERYGAAEPEAFAPRALQCRMKRQTPATARQRRYLERLAQYYGIVLPELERDLTRSEASRLTDKLLARYGKPSAEDLGAANGV